jgi:hypothetical protein
MYRSGNCARDDDFAIPRHANLLNVQNAPTLEAITIVAPTEIRELRLNVRSLLDAMGNAGS